ncbi:MULTISPECIES: hypothetical protein, partial [Enterobacteriaceae]|uniref:hypothetical protein n=1 Tax=Enterobacteriaceae TaxID=543 RepID=UPI0009E55EFB
SAKGDDKFITTDYLQQCRIMVLNNLLNWLPFGYGSYFLLSLISLPSLSDGGFFYFSSSTA